MKKEMYYLAGALYLTITEGEVPEMLSKLRALGASIDYVTAEMVVGKRSCDIEYAEALVGDGWAWKKVEQWPA